jgi:hypothetical protein
MSDEITITIRKGDLAAITTAFWVCSEIATGGMIDARRDYLEAASALSGIKERIEKAAVTVADV